MSYKRLVTYSVIPVLISLLGFASNYDGAEVVGILLEGLVIARFFHTRWVRDGSTPLGIKSSNWKWIAAVLALVGADHVWLSGQIAAAQQHAIDEAGDLDRNEVRSDCLVGGGYVRHRRW